jgi:hypothetical protein
LKIESLAGYKIESPMESGRNENENARLKAVYYWNFIKNPVLSIDNGIYLESILLQNQPGIFIRRLSKKIQKIYSNREIFSYWYEILKKHSSIKCKLKKALVLYDGKKEYMQSIEIKFFLKIPKYKDIPESENNPMNHFLFPVGFGENLFDIKESERIKYEKPYERKVRILLEQARLI